MTESSTENILPKDNNNEKMNQTQSHENHEILQQSLKNEILATNSQLLRQIKNLDKKNTRIEELLSSINKDVKNTVQTIGENYQITSNVSDRISEFQTQVSQLQTLTEELQQAIDLGLVSKKSKKSKKDKKRINKKKKKGKSGKKKHK